VPERAVEFTKFPTKPVPQFATTDVALEVPEPLDKQSVQALFSNALKQFDEMS
jgi:hypothetical protein